MLSISRTAPDRPLAARELPDVCAETAGHLTVHSRPCCSLLAEGHLTRRLFGAMLPWIWALPVSVGQPDVEWGQTRRTARQRADRCLTTGLGQEQFSTLQAPVGVRADPCGQCGSPLVPKAVLRG